MKINHKMLSEEQLEAMKDAALEAVDCVRVLTKSGGNLVGEVLKDHGEFTEWDHYPPGDIYDDESHAQFYFHAHPPEARETPDYGHFHTFLRPEGMPKSVKPAKVEGDKKDEDDILCHLIAISMTQAGLPERLFTTNRWVTGETWYKAEDVIKCLDNFVIDLAYPSWPLNRWITAMFILFRPQIEHLLRERDDAVEQWQKSHPKDNVYEDRALELTSDMEISLVGQIEWLDDVFEGNAS